MRTHSSMQTRPDSRFPHWLLWTVWLVLFSILAGPIQPALALDPGRLDLNEDGYVDGIDLRALANLPEDYKCFGMGDLDENGYVTVVDRRLAIRWLLENQPAAAASDEELDAAFCCLLTGRIPYALTADGKDLSPENAPWQKRVRSLCAELDQVRRVLDKPATAAPQLKPVRLILKGCPTRLSWQKTLDLTSLETLLEMDDGSMHPVPVNWILNGPGRIADGIFHPAQEYQRVRLRAETRDEKPVLRAESGLLIMETEERYPIGLEPDDVERTVNPDTLTPVKDIVPEYVMKYQDGYRRPVSVELEFQEGVVENGCLKFLMNVNPSQKVRLQVIHREAGMEFLRTVWLKIRR